MRLLPSIPWPPWPMRSQSAPAQPPAPLARRRRGEPLRVPRTEAARQEVRIDEIFQLIEAGSIINGARWWNRAAIWQAQWQYSQDGYTHELVENVVDFAIGSAALVDFGDEDLNEDWMRWRWNPLSPSDTPIDLQRLIGTHLVRDGDVFLEQLVPESGEYVRLLPLDPRHIWSYGTGSANEYLGVRLNDRLEPEAYLYRPSAVQPQEAEPRAWRDIPADTVIHHFRTDWPGQTRGEPWIRRALPYLAILEDFDRLSYRAMRRMTTNPGYWSYPVEYMLQDASEESFDPEDPDETALVREIYRRVLSETRWEDVDVEPRLPQEIEWKGKALTSLSDSVIYRVRRALIERIARSVGISALTLSADSEGLNFLAARVTSQGDQRFYSTLQSLARNAMRDVVEYYLDWAMNSSPLWQQRWNGSYRIDMPSYPYQDPLKDAAAIKMQIDSGILSPQQAIRDAGRDPERTIAEILDWRARVGAPDVAAGSDIIDDALDEEADDDDY